VCRCIPYRYKIGGQTSVGANEELEVLVITSKKGKRMLFPKVSLYQIEYFDIPFFKKIQTFFILICKYR
jgi:hypothetical protein